MSGTKKDTIAVVSVFTLSIVRRLQRLTNLSHSVWVLLFGMLSACACPGGREFHNLDGERVNELKAMLQKMDEKELDKFLTELNMAKDIVPKQVILKFKAGTSSSKVQETLKILSANKLYEFKSSNALLINIPNALKKQDIFAIVTALNEVKSIDYAEPNAILKVKALPTDPEFPKLDGLRNTGQTGGTAGADIRAEKAWDITKGSRGIRVAVTDTGVDYLHPDIATNIWQNPGELGIDNQGREKSTNGVDDDNNGYIDDFHGWDFVNNDNAPMDDYGHGTHVAGTIGAVGNNGIGVTGVNWTVGIVPLKFIDSEGNGDEALAVKAIEYAAAMNIPIINASWGGWGHAQALKDAIEAAGNKGSLFVAAAGNWGYDNDTINFSPSNFDLDNIISVAAVDSKDNKTSFSNFGSMKVHIAAPGLNILSLGLSDNGKDAPLVRMDGTSMAAPHVAGAAALIKSLFPQASVAEVKKRILYGADAINSLLQPNLPQDMYRPDRWPVDNPLVRGGRRLNIFRSLETDVTPPGAASNLRINFSGVSMVEVLFNAAGDDGDSGQASGYVAAISSEPIIAPASWEGRKTIDLSHVNTQTPGLVRAEVPGLELGQSGYITIRAIDNVGNMGPLSSSLAFEISRPAVHVASNGESYDGINSQEMFHGSEPFLQEEISGRGKVWSDSPGGPRAAYHNNYMEFTQNFTAPHPDVLLQFDTKLDCDPIIERANIEYRMNEATDPMSSYMVWNPDRKAYDWFQSPLWRPLAIYTATKCDWRTVSLPLRNKMKVGDKIRLRFWFQMLRTDTPDRDGWLIDDIKFLYPSTPEKPVGFIATKSNETAPYTLRWNDMSSGETRFEIARFSGSSEPLLFAETRTNVAVYEPGLTTVDQTLRVRACNGPLCSEYSEPIQIRLPAPTLGNISPVAGPLAGVNLLTVNGTGFISGSVIRVKGENCPETKLISPTVMSCKLAPQAAGTYSVVVVNPDGQRAILNQAYTYQPAPTITSISPTGGPLSGGNILTINGANFLPGAIARIQGVDCTNIKLISGDQMTCAPAARNAGSYNVGIINPDMQKAVVTGAYTYRSAPVVTSVSPAKLRVRGGEALTVKGTGFVANAVIKVGQALCGAVAVQSATQATCTTPSLSPGAHAVSLVNNDGQASTITASVAVTAVSPAWVATNGGSCPKVCSGVGLSSRLSPEGSYCASGEHLPASAVSKIPFRYGCWPYKDCRAQGTRSGIQVAQYCYGANQKRDKSKPDITVGCYCDL